MAKSKYFGIITRSKDEKEKAALARQATRAEFQINIDIAAAKDAIADAEIAVDEVISALPFDSETVLEARRAVREAKEDLADLEAIKADYFDAEAEEEASAA